MNHVKAMLASLGALAVYAKQVTIEALERKCDELVAQARAIQDRADADGQRELTPEENTEIEAIFATHEKTTVEISRRKRLAAIEARQFDSAGRKTAPTPGAGMEVSDGATLEGGDKNGARKGTGGFVDLGDFAVCVKRAVRGDMDARIRKIMDAVPGAPSQEGVGADGGYLVPPDFRTSIFQKVMSVDSLLGRTDQQTSSGNSITFPTDEEEPWSAGGVQAYWEGEGHLIKQSKPAATTTTVRAHKLAALIPVTDEQLEDGPSLEPYLRRKVVDKFNYKINDAIVRGDGVGKPLGILNAGCKIMQTKEGGQAAATLNYNNISKMWSRCYAPNRANSIWLINQDIEPALDQLVAPGATNAMLPAYLPPGGLSAAPYGTLKGRPVIPSECCSTLGTEGDIILVDPSVYLSLIKNGGVKSDVSMHLWFDYGLQAFRFTLRIGGQPWWSKAITPAKTATTRSMIVTLETR